MSHHDQHGFSIGDRVLACIHLFSDKWYPAHIVHLAHVPTFTDPPLRLKPVIIIEGDPYGEGTEVEWEQIQPESIVDKLGRLA